VKDYEDGKKCLSPSIFRKTKGPIIFTAQGGSLNGGTTFELNIKGI
jgi:hypothetical protein